MERKINIIDFETGKSVSITVDEEDMIDTLLNNVRNYWLKDGITSWPIPVICWPRYVWLKIII